MKKNILLPGLVFAFLVGISISSHALNISRIDLSYQYDPAASVKASYRVTQKGDKITIFLLIQADSIGLWSKEYLIQNGYESEAHQNIIPDEIVFESNAQVWYGGISFIFPKKENLLLLKFGGVDFNFYFDIPLVNGGMPFPDFYPTAEDLPIITPFLSTNKLNWSLSNTLHTTSYSDDFEAAEAPMEEMKALVPTIMENGTFMYKDSSQLNHYDFYTFRIDSTSSSSITLLKTPPYYPSSRVIHELIGPIKYITTEVEYKTLIQSNRPKITFDEFWINTFGTKFRARNAIRKYFKSVEYANQYFTNFKQGWKTDRGMIFIVYGTPEEMYRTGTTEVWVYENQEFEFLKVSTLFAPILALRKEDKYEKDWYKAVGKLRKGE